MESKFANEIKRLLDHEKHLLASKGKLVRHFKGKEYKLLDFAEHTETGEKLVIYQAMYGNYKVYARPFMMFASEVDRDKYPEVEQQFRFEVI